MIFALFTIFLISNRNLSGQTLIHCSRNVIRGSARTHTHKLTHTKTNTIAVAVSIIPKIHVKNVDKITAKNGIASSPYQIQLVKMCRAARI